MTNHPVDEAKILRPRPLSQDDNSWPIFILKDVDVFSTEQRKRRLDDIWKADLKFPLVVEGTLDKLPRRMWKHSLTNADPSGTRIRIPACTHWAYGQYDDGEVAFWAAGRSGWFEIKPSRAYSNSYKATRQAIEYLYFVADFYRAHAIKSGARAGQLRCPLANVFAEYAEKAVHKCSDEESARVRLYTHRDVLLSLMNRRLECEGWTWSKTEIYNFLSQEEDEPSDSSEQDQSTGVTPEPSSPGSDDSRLSRSNPRRLAGKGKSTLRPKSSKHAGKARLKSKAEDEDEQMPDRQPSPSSKRRKLSHQTYHDEGLGNNLIEIEGEEEDKPVRRRRGRPPKHPPRTLPSPSESEREADQEDPEPDEEEEDEEMDEETAKEALIESSLPLRLRSGRVRAPPSPAPMKSTPKPPTTPLTKLAISSTKVPDIGPNTPGMSDTFTCPFDGCAHRVYAASTQPAKELIREHYGVHADEREKRMELIMAEERPYLPVNHLMRKIRDMAALAAAEPKGLAALGGEILSAEPVDAGVRRRY